MSKISESKKNPSLETRTKMKTSHEGKIPWNKGLKGTQVTWNKGQTKVIL